MGSDFVFVTTVSSLQHNQHDPLRAQIQQTSSWIDLYLFLEVMVEVQILFLIPTGYNGIQTHLVELAEHFGIPFYGVLRPLHGVMRAHDNLDPSLYAAESIFKIIKSSSCCLYCTKNIA